MNSYVIAQLGNSDSICAWLQPASAESHFGGRATAETFATRYQAAKAAGQFAGHKFRVIRVGGEADPGGYAAGNVHNWRVR